MAKKNNKKKSAPQVNASKGHTEDSVKLVEEVGTKVEREVDNANEDAAPGPNPQTIDQTEEPNIEPESKKVDTEDEHSAEEIKQLKQKIVELTLELSKSKKQQEDPVKVTDNSSEIAALKDKLQETEEEKEQIQEQYDQLLARIGSMKAVFSKMKESQNDLEQAQEQIEEYERQNMNLKQKNESLVKEKSQYESTIKLLKEESESLNLECDRLSHELTNLRSNTENTESSWDKEKRQLNHAITSLEKEVEQLRETNEEYLITLENDTLVNSSLNQEITNLNDRLSELMHSKKSFEESLRSSEGQIETLQSKIQDLQSSSSASAQDFKIKIEQLEQQIASEKSQQHQLQDQIEDLTTSASKSAKLEQDLKEKQLQIGKLRHEAVILNEHLTKALQLIKRNSDSETVDKELVTNLFISFLNLPRGDTKKFEVLQLISNFLNWDDDKKIQAGLSHIVKDPSKRGSRESFVSLWTEYLENESTKKT